MTLFLAIDAVSEDPDSDPCDGDAETRHGRVRFQAVAPAPLPCVRRNQEALPYEPPLCLLVSCEGVEQSMYQISKYLGL